MLYDKTKRHKDGFDLSAYQEFKKLHDTQIEVHGEDNLSVTAAYLEILKPSSGHSRGLGPGARAPTMKGSSGQDTTELREHMSSEMQWKAVALERETLLLGQVETLRTSNEELKASNKELKESVELVHKQAIEREAKLAEKFQKMFDQLRSN